MAITIPIVTDFDARGINRAQREFGKLETNGERAGFVIKKAAVPAAIALLALGVAAVDAAKAAIEDSAAADQLARSIDKTTTATPAAIAGVEGFITAMSRAAAVSDDHLRPALATLARGTGNLRQAQDGLRIALDVSAATSKPLETVALALSKAYAGNATALGKLDPHMKALIKNGASADQVIAAMAKRFGGDAAAGADTAAGKMRGFGISVQETKESIGAALMPIINAALPLLQRFGQWAQQHSTVFVTLAAVIGGVAVAIMLANVATTVLSISLSPIALTVLAVVAGLVLLTAGFVLAYKKSDTFRGIIDKIGEVFQAVFGWISAHSGPILDALKLAFKLMFAPLYVGLKALEKIKDAISWIGDHLPDIEGKGTVPDILKPGGADAANKYANAIERVSAASAKLKAITESNVRGARQAFAGMGGSLASMIGQRAAAPLTAAANAKQDALDKVRAKRQKDALTSAANDQDATAQERADAAIALADFVAQEEINADRDAAAAAGKSAEDRVIALTAAFNKGLIPAQDFQNSLNEIIGESGGVAMGAGFVAGFETQLADLQAALTQLTPFAGRGQPDPNVALPNLAAPKPKKNPKKKPRKMASGGIVTSATLALIGEAGPEAVIPLSRGRRAMGGMNGITINVQAGLVSTPDQIGQQIIEAIQQAQRRSGPVFASA